MKTTELQRRPSSLPTPRWAGRREMLFPSLRIMENLLEIVRMLQRLLYIKKQKCIAVDKYFQDIMFISIMFTIIVIISSIVIINIMISLDDLSLTNFSLPCVSLFSAFGVLHILVYRSCICFFPISKHAAWGVVCCPIKSSRLLDSKVVEGKHVLLIDRNLF